MDNAWFRRFERHAHGAGLKGHSTHYCAGCGHGLVHKYLVEAITKLGVQDRTVAISPVGCAVFMYYYLDVGNTQAAHGRAPAVALGHKLANPNSVVISYQGDGDLAAIGLAEIIQAAQLGIPLTVIFVNNAIYGMTGGQMAPTTLMGQETTTTPSGRSRLTGQPLKMAEMMAQLDGPVYVERVALYDNKQRVRAQKAIAKAIRIQADNRGLGFVEVLSECPTHLHLTPQQTEQWVQEHMLPVFPLGVKKDVDVDSWGDWPVPSFEPRDVLRVIGASPDRPRTRRKRFPSHIDPDDVAIKFAGAGGDGAQTAALLIARTAINAGYDATHLPCYGPESRGGTSYADVHVAKQEVLSPAAPNPHVLVAFNPQSVLKFGPALRPGGTVLYDSTIVVDSPSLDRGIRCVGIPFTQIALDLGTVKVKNIVALGAMQAATRLFSKASFLATMRLLLEDQCALLPVNERALGAGIRAYREVADELRADNEPTRR